MRLYFIYGVPIKQTSFYTIKSFEIKPICPHTFYSGISSATTLFSHYSSNESYVNPVVNSDHPDPGILALPDNSGYVVVTTSHFNSRSGPAFPILFSTDLVNWQHVSCSCSPLELKIASSKLHQINCFLIIDGTRIWSRPVARLG